jgi:FkbM family methyltransferase
MLNPEQIKNQHPSVFDEIITNNQYHISESDISGKVVIDIGANNGVFSLLANDYKAEKIIAIESNPEVFSLLSNNVKDLLNVTAMNKAAASTSNKMVNVGREPYFGNIDGRCYVVDATNGNIPTISINDLLTDINKEVVLKLDCEGSEYDILYSISPINFKKVSEILLEAHEGLGSAPKGVEHIDKLSSYIQSSGFKITDHKNYVGNSVQLFKFVKDENFKEDITILVNCFNRPEYLQTQIDSLLSQSIVPEKIIVLSTKPYKDFSIPRIDGVDYIIVENDQGLNTRFAAGLVAKTRYLCILDDDIIPGCKWIETCLNIIKKENSIICGYGIRYTEKLNDASGKKFGDHGVRSEKIEYVDMAGHSWFMKREWLKYFWMEEPFDWEVSDDIHLSYTMKKYGNIKLLVSPYPENDKDVWGNIKPEWGLGRKALHARSQEDKELWEKPDYSNDWNNDDTPRLNKNLIAFTIKRKDVLKKYIKRGFDLSNNSTILPARKNTETIPEITAVISTKDRYYSTLPHTILAICQQTLKPKNLIIYDDGEHKDLRNDPLYSHIFHLISYYGIEWFFEFGERKGQVLNHIKSLKHRATKEWLIRFDDDNVPEYDVLEKLARHIAPDVGAIGGLVIQADSIQTVPPTASNKIENIYLGQNEQWYLHPNKEVKEVDHLYSSFLYRKDIAEYCTELSNVCHREESLLTYSLKIKGYKNILDTSAITWHFTNPTGGIRSNPETSHNNAMHDEAIFSKKMQEWGVKATDYSMVVLDNGIGDHFAFKNILPAYFEKNKGKKHIFYVCYPEIFEDIKNITLDSIASAKMVFGNIDKFNIYKWCIDNRWKNHIIEAFKICNQVNYETKPVLREKSNSKNIIISPYSQSKDHPKSYPYWNDLIPMIKSCGYNVIQIGRKGEERLIGTDEFMENLSFKSIENLISECHFWISVDNFLPHLINNMKEIVPGVVIFGLSDPKIFGYPYNRNILRSSILLRTDQFGTWHGMKQNKDMFNKAEIVFKDLPV